MMNKTLLISFFLVTSLSCFGQKTIEFQSAHPKADTIGWWVNFRDSIINNRKTNLNINNPKDSPLIITRLLKSYFGDESFRNGNPVTTSQIGINLTKDSFPHNFITRYAAIKSNNLSVRLEEKLTGESLTLSFQQSNNQWTYVKEPTNNIHAYVSLFSYSLHTRKSTLVAQNPGVIKTLQTKCSDFIHPYFIDVDCIIELINTENLMDDPQFIEGLKKIDNRTYGKL